MPRSEDYQVRAKMDKYNKSRMPHLKQTVQLEELDQRKRRIKADLKRAAEKLRQQTNSGRLPEIMSADLNYLHKEPLTSEGVQDCSRHKYEHCKHITKVSTKRPILKKSLFESRKRPRDPDHLEEQELEPAKIEGESGPVYLQVEKNSAIM